MKHGSSKLKIRKVLKKNTNGKKLDYTFVE